MALSASSLVPAREGDEAFFAGGAMREIGLENAFDRARRVVRHHIAIELPAEGRIRPEAAADDM